MKENNQFGSHNTETGESKIGYMDKGRMCFRKPNILERIKQSFASLTFKDPLDKWEEKYVGTTKITLTNWRGQKAYYNESLYLCTHLKSKKQRLVARSEGRERQLDINAWEDGKVVEL